MASGGRRQGAGRRPGSVNKTSQRAREEAALTGELPHEFLLRVSRGEAVDKHAPTFSERTDAAKAAAPYFAPRLASAHVDLHQNGGDADWLHAPEGTDPRYMNNCQLTATIISGIASDRDDWTAFCWDKNLKEALDNFIEKHHMATLNERIQKLKSTERDE